MKEFKHGVSLGECIGLLVSIVLALILLFNLTEIVQEAIFDLPALLNDAVVLLLIVICAGIPAYAVGFPLKRLIDRLNQR